MSSYRCTKHGMLDPSERLVWGGDPSKGRWCIYCFNEAMKYIISEHCGAALIEMNDDEKENVNVKPD